jgi:hypothetical protein
MIFTVRSDSLVFIFLDGSSLDTLLSAQHLGHEFDLGF